MTIAPIKCAVICGFACLIATAGQDVKGQQLDEKQGQQDVSKLKSDVKLLIEQQQQIISQLTEIKQLVAGSKPVHPPATVSVSGEPFQGAAGAQVAIIEYADFECSFCGDFMRETYPQIVNDYIKTGKVKYFFRDMPMQSHPHAITAARGARCAGEQGKFWDMHKRLFANQAALADKDLVNQAKQLGLDDNRFSECLSSKKYTEDIQKSASEAQKMGIDGTPTFLLGMADPNGEVVKIEQTLVGASPYDTFRSSIDDLLAGKKR